METYKASKDLVAWNIEDDEAIIIHTKTADYFSLNQSATWVWLQLIEAPLTIAETSSRLAARYQLPITQVKPDVDALFEQLSAAQLIVEGHGAHAMATPQNSSPAPLDLYAPPELVKFGDLETLILSGE